MNRFSISRVYGYHRSDQTRSFPMIRSYIHMAFRTMRRHPAFALLNVFGLGLGLLASFMVLLWVQDEMGIDHFHEDSSQIYQVLRTSTFGGNTFTIDEVSTELDKVLDEEYAGIEYTSMLSGERTVSFVRGDRAFRNIVRTAGPDIFRILTFPFIAGDPETALVAPESVVLSEGMARIYFPEFFRGVTTEVAARNLLGQSIRYENHLDLTITGIAYDAPDNSSIGFAAFLPFELFAREVPIIHSWGSNAFRMYVKLLPGAAGDLVSREIREIYFAHGGESSNTIIFLQPVQDRYLWSRYENGVLVGGRIEYVRIMSIVGLLILLIAAINFTNLATARSARRALEIGIRKSFGGSRRGLAGQFMGESLVMSLVALLVALGAITLMLPAFNAVTGKSVSLLAAPSSTWLGMFGLTLLMGLAAGIYPALYLSGLGVIRALSKGDSGLGGGGGLRRTLVVFQFSASMLLIVGSMTVYSQLQYIQSKNLGLDRENVISAKLEGGAEASWGAFKASLLKSPAILEVTTTDSTPLDLRAASTDPTWQGKPDNDNTLYYMVSTGHDYLETMRMELVAGRNFDPSRAADSANVIVNETAARRMGFDQPIGKALDVWGRSGQIIGVVKDFHMTSLYRPIQPTILRLDEGRGGTFFTRTAPGKSLEALTVVEAAFREFSPGYPFEPTFLDAEYQEMYRSENVIGMLANWFAILAVTIACLGLYGLASFTTSRRTKEIGVRKVLGAT
ncbi:ABC transporter permease, partial [Rhodothermus sp. AH-315-K08]|nr:ABC transporter permease [Rhodothermus sp. AH-315-K08]